MEVPAKAKRIYWAKRIESINWLCTLLPDIRLANRDSTKTHVRSGASAHDSLRLSTSQLGMLVAGGDKRYDRDDELRHLTYTTVFGLLACTGLRISEALQLHIEDVESKHRVITVREKEKCRRLRLVPLTARRLSRCATTPGSEINDSRVLLLFC